MKKIDLKKEHKNLYGTTSRQRFIVVDVPRMNYLMIDGEGDPNTAQSFTETVEALYSLSYPLKFSWDNAPMESFFDTLNTELIYQQKFQTREQAQSAIFEYIECFYNRERLHSSIGYTSPEKYELTKAV